MVAMADEFRRRWEMQREHRELAELEQLAAWLLGLCGMRQPDRHR